MQHYLRHSTMLDCFSPLKALVGGWCIFITIVKINVCLQCEFELWVDGVDMVGCFEPLSIFFFVHECICHCLEYSCRRCMKLGIKSQEGALLVGSFLSASQSRWWGKEWRAARKCVATATPRIAGVWSCRRKCLKLLYITKRCSPSRAWLAFTLVKELSILCVSIYYVCEQCKTKIRFHNNKIIKTNWWG